MNTREAIKSPRSRRSQHLPETKVTDFQRPADSKEILKAHYRIQSQEVLKAKIMEEEYKRSMKTCREVKAEYPVKAQYPITSQPVPSYKISGDFKRPVNTKEAYMLSVSKEQSYSDLVVRNSIKSSGEFPRQKKTIARNSLKPQHRSRVSLFNRLPREIYDCIIAQLEQVYLGQGQECPSCYLKDLHSLSLTSQSWYRAANFAL